MGGVCSSSSKKKPIKQEVPNVVPDHPPHQNLIQPIPVPQMEIPKEPLGIFLLIFK